jgi:hypothetical protein
MQMNEYVKELENQVDPTFVEKIKDWPVETKLYMYLHNIQLAMMKEFKDNQVVYPKIDTKNFMQWNMPMVEHPGFPNIKDGEESRAKYDLYVAKCKEIDKPYVSYGSWFIYQNRPVTDTVYEFSKG